MFFGIAPELILISLLLFWKLFLEDKFGGNGIDGVEGIRLDLGGID